MHAHHHDLLDKLTLWIKTVQAKKEAAKKQLAERQQRLQSSLIPQKEDGAGARHLPGSVADIDTMDGLMWSRSSPSTTTATHLNFPSLGKTVKSSAASVAAARKADNFPPGMDSAQRTSSISSSNKSSKDERRKKLEEVKRLLEVKKAAAAAAAAGELSSPPTPPSVGQPYSAKLSDHNQKDVSIKNDSADLENNNTAARGAFEAGCNSKKTQRNTGTESPQKSSLLLKQPLQSDQLQKSYLEAVIKSPPQRSAPKALSSIDATAQPPDAAITKTHGTAGASKMLHVRDLSKVLLSTASFAAQMQSRCIENFDSEFRATNQRVAHAFVNPSPSQESSTTVSIKKEKEEETQEQAVQGPLPEIQQSTQLAVQSNKSPEIQRQAFPNNTPAFTAPFSGIRSHHSPPPPPPLFSSASPMQEQSAEQLKKEWSQFSNIPDAESPTPMQIDSQELYFYSNASEKSSSALEATEEDCERMIDAMEISDSEEEIVAI